MELKIEYKPISELKSYKNNPRKNDGAVEIVKKSIQEFGFKVPIIIDKNNEIIAGHTRVKAAKELNITEVPTIKASDLTPEQVKAFRIMDNRSQEFSFWDEDLLQQELAELKELNFDLELIGFPEEEESGLSLEKQREEGGLLAKDIVVLPAYSVFDGRSRNWIERTRKWRQIIPLSECVESREGALADPNNMYGKYRSVSVFNHTLAEVLVRGFSAEGEVVLIPFAEASISVVAAVLDRKVWGIELRKEQVEIDNKLIQKFNKVESKVIQGDALDEKNYTEADFILTCPPYMNLEKYSDLKEDLSNMDKENFFKSMDIFFGICYKYLKDNRFMAVVFGNIRDGNGEVIDIVSEVRKIAKSKGFKLYNDIIFLQPQVTTASRQRQFTATRKVVRCHEEISIFYKGNLKEVKNRVAELNKSVKTKKNGNIEVILNESTNLE